MKKILLLLIALSVGLSGYSQGRGEVDYHNLLVERKGDNVEVSFQLEVGGKAVKSDYSLLIRPVLEGDLKYGLTCVRVQGRRARISRNRKALSGRVADPLAGGNTISLLNGDIYDYAVSIPYEEWMDGARLVMYFTTEGCCTVVEQSASEIARDLALRTREPESITEIAVIPEAEPRVSTGDRVALDYPFMAHTDEQSSKVFTDRMSPESMDSYIDLHRDRGLAIYFAQGYRVIDRDFGDNDRSLIKLVDAIRAIDQSEDTKLVGVVISGFASPEGRTRLNEKLAGNRAAALKEFILDNSTLTERDVKIYNGAVDWRGLRRLVDESAMSEKDQVLHIIDTCPVWDAATQTGRRSELMKLNRGESYRYMFRTFFPKLRNAAYIRIYYENVE
ncbi:hypothetical protein [uncultured Alistipes sp.]|uniref:hypothetical protein n=1 Tax=uncultured Alistipes sp. TaxID=538949 RepID=UPI0025CD2525|nr:hypothetical protein [uncultured Alistipes sp.]